MEEELTLCAAAFFRNKGKTVSTTSEFLMSISMDYHWFPMESAKKILATMVENKVLERNGDNIKPAFDIASIQIPVAYKPDSSLATRCEGATAKKPEQEPQPQKNMLPILIEKATSNGMQKKDFIANANHLSKTLNVDMIVAGLLVLRENGIDVSQLIEPVYSEIKSK